MNGISHLHHLGLLNKALAKSWDDLAPEEKGIWEEEAEHLNADATEKVLKHPQYVLESHIHHLGIANRFFLERSQTTKSLAYLKSLERALALLTSKFSLLFPMPKANL